MPIRHDRYAIVSIIVQVRTMQFRLHKVQLHNSGFRAKYRAVRADAMKILYLLRRDKSLGGCDASFTPLALP